VSPVGLAIYAHNLYWTGTRIGTVSKIAKP
jgi:hypothetical protein